MNRVDTKINLELLRLVTALIVLGIGVSLILGFFPQIAETHPTVSVIERVYYCVTGIISISVIWNLVQSLSELMRHQVDLGNMVRKAKLEGNFHPCVRRT